MFRENSLVLMYDGTTKQIKDIRAFEKVKVFDYKTMSYDMGVVVGIHKENAKDEFIKYMFDDNSVLETTGNTLFLTSYGFNYNNQLQVGDVVYSPSGSKTLVRIEKDIIEEEVYALDVEDVDNYVCGDVVVHNEDYVTTTQLATTLADYATKDYVDAATTNLWDALNDPDDPNSVVNQLADINDVLEDQAADIEDLQDDIEELQEDFEWLDTNKATITTTAPTADNTTGTPILVLLTSAPAQQYEGYIYFVRVNNENNS